MTEIQKNCVKNLIFYKACAEMELEKEKILSSEIIFIECFWSTIKLITAYQNFLKLKMTIMSVTQTYYLLFDV